MAKQCLPAVDDFHYVQAADKVASELAHLTTFNWSAAFRGEWSTKDDSAASLMYLIVVHNVHLNDTWTMT